MSKEENRKQSVGPTSDMRSRSVPFSSFILQLRTQAPVVLVYFVCFTCMFAKTRNDEIPWLTCLCGAHQPREIS